jgi:predicted alpha/beta hydrolase
LADSLIATTVDGVTLRLERLAAVGPRRGAVVCVHAMMSDGRYFGARRGTGLARVLADAGLDVIVADLRGHGDSRPPDPRRDDWCFDDYVDFDLPAIVTAAAAATGCAVGDLAVLGHSLGGLVAAASLATARIPPIRALALAGTGVWLGGDARDRLRRRAVMAMYSGVTRVVGYAPVRALRIGSSDEPRGYVAQLAHWARAGRWTSLRGTDYLAALRAITAPTVSVVGARDWMCTPRDAGEIAGRIATAAPMRVVGRAHGDAVDADHFGLVTREELAPVWRSLARALVATV